MTRCSWAACLRPAARVVEQWPMCAPHVAEHYALNGEKPCRLCGLPFTPERAGTSTCPICRVDPPRRQRSDAGRRKTVDSAVRRCGWCGEWNWGAAAAAACCERRAA
jgi:hypothetical protein